MVERVRTGEAGIGPGFRSPGLVALTIVVLAYSVVGALLVRDARHHQEVQDHAVAFVLALERLQAVHTGLRIGEASPMEWKAEADAWTIRRATVDEPDPELLAWLRALDASLSRAAAELSANSSADRATMDILAYDIARAVQRFQVVSLSRLGQARLKWARVVVVLGLSLAFAFITIVMVSLAEARRMRAQDLSDQVQDANSALRTAQERLGRSEERYALAARGANDGLFDWDVRAGKIYFSPRFREMVGDFLMGDDPEDWLRHLPADDRREFEARIDGALAGQATNFEHEYRLLRGDGTERWMLTRAAIVRSEGAAVRVAGSLTDITDRRRVAAAEEKVQLLEEATEALGVGVTLLDRDLHAVRPSSHLRRLTREFGGVDAWWAAARDSLTEAFPGDGAENVVVDLTSHGANRRVFGLSWSERGRELAHDDAAAYLLLVQDQTAAHLATERRIALTEQLRDARDEALRASESRSRLLKRLGRELRAPLRAVLDAVEEHADDSLPRIQVAAGLIEQVVDGVVELSRLESAEPTFRLEDISTQALLAPIVAEARELAEATGNAFVSPRAFEGRMRTDAEAVRDVLRELLANAFRYTVDGTVSLSSRVNRSVVRLQVRDTGEGIDPRVRQRLTEPFVRGTPPAGRGHQGAGLGLALVARTVERLGGTLEWRSTTGEGTSVAVELPCTL
ncbi:MAG: PAS domain S-box-containing protein [Myxococcota bacterium]